MSGFVDEVRLVVRSGDGGSGAVSFNRTKLKPRGRPDGGNGGRGGSVVVVADPAMATLSAYQRSPHHRASSGGKGGPNNRSGAEATDLVLRVPVGTLVRDERTGEVLADLAKPDARFVAAPGGRGGKGNAALKSSVDRVPNYSEAGEPGREASIVLELRLVADVGLLGPPNAGKSTLLRAISRATPKVADYPFTTLEPVLGVVGTDQPFVACDLPGLIEGASEGKGMGTRFLRHATRCRVLAAVVDLASPDPASELEAVAGEVDAYDRELSERLCVVVGNKIDLPDADATGAEAWAAARGAEFVGVSAMHGTGVAELVAVLERGVAAAVAAQPERETFAVLRPVVADRIVVRREGSGWRVTSERAERLVAQTPLGNAGAVRRLQRRLRSLGVETALAREGAVEGDDVYIGDSTFEFLPEQRRA